MSTLKQNPAIASRNFEGLYVLVDPELGTLHELNAVGSRVWELCDGQRSPEQLAQTISEEFVVSQEDALDDIRVFLDEMLKKNLLFH